MKVSRALALLGAIGLALTPLSAADATHGGQPKGYDISFDGYCDGLHLNIPSVGLPENTRTVDGDQIGCVSGGVFGQARPSASGQYGVTKGAEFVTIPGYSSFATINSDHTWVLYIHNGNDIALLNSGTWSLGPPTAGPESRSIFSPAAARTPGAAPLSIDAVKEISFDGYCDGLHLVSPSEGLGQRGTVDGYRTGCASEGLIGAKTKIGKSANKAYVVQFDNGTWIQATIFKNHTWALFSISGSAIFLLNSGTWSDGPPPLRAGAASTA